MYAGLAEGGREKAAAKPVEAGFAGERRGMSGIPNRERLSGEHEASHAADRAGLLLNTTPRRFAD